MTNNFTRHASEKQSTGSTQTGAKLYQKYRKFYENERKENEKLKKLLETQASDMKRIKS